MRKYYEFIDKDFYKKTVKRLPRKLKKKVKKIPAGCWCYGDAIGDRGRMINGKRVYKTHFCPYHRKYDEISFCTFVKIYDDLELHDSVKICPSNKFNWLIEPAPEYTEGVRLKKR